MALPVYGWLREVVDAAKILLATISLPHPRHRRTSMHSFGDHPRTNRLTSPASRRSARSSDCQTVSSWTTLQAPHWIGDDTVTGRSPRTR